MLISVLLLYLFMRGMRVTSMPMRERGRRSDFVDVRPDSGLCGQTANVVDLLRLLSLPLPVELPGCGRTSKENDLARSRSSDDIGARSYPPNAS